MSEKQRNLLEYKEKLLHSLRQCEIEIETAKASQNRKRTFIDSDSDSDEEPLHHSRIYSLSELHSEYSSLNTCLKATKELTDLIVLESNINVIAEPDDLENDSIVTEEGVWKEVIAECKIDLVAFSIFFYQHQPKRKFSAPTFHNLKVNVIKKAHEKELERSVLKYVTKPSDVIQIIKSFAQATRSRRSTLSRIAEKYPDGHVFMELLPDGGYVLKCCNLLQLEWHLHNRLSVIAPFYHKMCFNLECMDKEYIREIKKIYKTIQNPGLTTDERTALLLKVIAICLKVERLNATHMSEDAPGVTSKKTTLDAREIDHQDIPEGREKDECQVMAPPRSIPKKKTPQKSQSIVNTQRKFKNNLNKDVRGGNTENVLVSQKENLNFKSKDNNAGNTDKMLTTHNDHLSVAKSTKADKMQSTNKNKVNKAGNTEKEIPTNTKPAGNTEKALTTHKEQLKHPKVSNTDKIKSANKINGNKAGNTEKETATSTRPASNTGKTLASHKEHLKNNKVSNSDKILSRNIKNHNRTDKEQTKSSNTKRMLTKQVILKNQATGAKSGNTENVKAVINTNIKSSKLVKNIKKGIEKNKPSKIPKLRISPRNPLKSSNSNVVAQKMDL